MTSSPNPSPADLRPDGKGAGFVLVACSALTFVLLANHPSGAARTFADMVREEAGNAGRDAFVHGTFIGVLAGQIACLAIMTIRLGLNRPLGIAGLVLTAIGASFMTASMLLDGLVTPAVAARYVGALDVAERQNDAKALFVLLGATLSFLMPAGLLFQGAGLACWSAVFARGVGHVRAIGVYGALVAIANIASVAATGAKPPHVLTATIVLLAVAYALMGVALLRRCL